MTVSLGVRQFASGDLTIPFEIDAERRRRLLDGLDDIGSSLRFAGEIAVHERVARVAQPWVGPIPDQLCS